LPCLRLVGIDGLPVAGKSTLSRVLAAATGGTCVKLDEFIKPEAEWRWYDRPSFPFAYIRYDEFLEAVTRLAANGWCRYQPYDYATGEVADAEREVRTDGPVFVEGVSARFCQDSRQQM
jgi:uridine kinase